MDQESLAAKPVEVRSSEGLGLTVRRHMIGGKSGACIPANGSLHADKANKRAYHAATAG